MVDIQLNILILELQNWKLLFLRWPSSIEIVMSLKNGVVLILEIVPKYFY